jgi:hypothetical protein
MWLTSHLGPNKSTNFDRYTREFVLTMIIKPSLTILYMDIISHSHTENYKENPYSDLNARLPKQLTLNTNSDLIDVDAANLTSIIDLMVKLW